MVPSTSFKAGQLPHRGDERRVTLELIMGTILFSRHFPCSSCRSTYVPDSSAEVLRHEHRRVAGYADDRYHLLL